MLTTRRKARIEFLEDTNKTLWDKMEQLLDTNAKQTAHISTMGAAIFQEQTKNAELRKKCEELAAFIKLQQETPTQFASGPLWMSEEEEDARYRYDSGDINGEMLRETLKELGLDPDITTEDS